MKAAITFAFELDGKGHAGTVASGPADSQTLGAVEPDPACNPVRAPRVGQTDVVGAHAGEQLGQTEEGETMSASLYDRLGGAAGISALVEDAIAAHLANPTVQTRFQNIKDIEHAKRMAREFFGAGSGGPEPYTGRDMRTAHRGMNISEQEYVAVMDDIMGALDRHRIDEVTKKDVLAIMYSLKNDIIRT